MEGMDTGNKFHKQITTGQTQKTKRPRPPAFRAAGVVGSRKKLVSRATLKGFIRGMHGHGVFYFSLFRLK